MSSAMNAWIPPHRRAGGHGRKKREATGAPVRARRSTYGWRTVVVAGVAELPLDPTFVTLAPHGGRGGAASMVREPGERSHLYGERRRLRSARRLQARVPASGGGD